MKHLYFKIILFFILLFSASLLQAEGSEVAIPAITGEITSTKIQKKETLMELALREGFGFENIVNSNKELDPWNPQTGSHITLPGRAITPFGSAQGIVINLAELRLFYITKSGQSIDVNVFPLGIGREGRATPEGEYRVVVKKEQPDWRVPAGLRSEAPELPAIVPPGPDNPLGDFWLGLSAPGYGIHGTNRPYGVGRRISYGCLRMYPDDIEMLYQEIIPGEKVLITYQPFKAAKDGNELFLEAHPDYLDRYRDDFQEALHVISKTGWPGEIDYALVKHVTASATGIPTAVGTLAKQ